MTTDNTQSPTNLKVISNVIHDESHGSQTYRGERRRRPRLNLASEQFRLMPQGKIFSVADLSTEGMAFRIIDRHDLEGLPVATWIDGILNVRGEKFTVRAQIRHLGNEVVGCQFDGLSEETRTGLERLLDPAVLGGELRPIPSSDAGTLWYHGPSGTDVLLARAVDGQYRRLTIFVLGTFIQWDLELGVSTGRAVASGDAPRNECWGMVQFETMLLEADTVPDPDKLSVAKALVLGSNLPQDLKKWCARQLGAGQGQS
jgi:hypothetical protein